MCGGGGGNRVMPLLPPVSNSWVEIAFLYEMKQIKDILRADILYAIFFSFFCKTEIDDFNMLL